ncbi:hypothetical protein CHELA1G11_10524 [Hyphomicrobiales bacterium]|nr:hypothetical protein CHELA1G11_10524 [Hyphomicrobiales bacterium]CAH1674067.1 hypothetical protein CHELA1G2_13779 [Hyphomicrobiales bacterium]
MLAALNVKKRPLRRRWHATALHDSGSPPSIIGRATRTGIRGPASTAGGGVASFLGQACPDTIEQCGEAIFKLCQRANNGDGDKRGDQAVFNSRGAFFIFHETRKQHYHIYCSLHQVLIIKRLSLFGATGTMAHPNTATIAPQLNSRKKRCGVFSPYRMVNRLLIMIFLYI